MGLFDFIKDIGRSGDEDDKKLEETLRAEIRKAQLGIDRFQIKVEKGLATLSGQAKTQKDLEIARLIVGNHKGVNKVQDDGLVLAPPPQTQAPAASGVAAPSPSGPFAGIPYAPAEMVKVQKGDTLSKIAERYLGDPQRYREIFDANRPMLKDPDEIYPGQVLRIPTEMIARAQGGSRPYASHPS